MDERDQITVSPIVMNGTYYLCLTRQMLEYIGFTDEDIKAHLAAGNSSGRLEVVVVGENSKKWGAFIGVGKKGIHTRTARERE